MTLRQRILKIIYPLWMIFNQRNRSIILKNPAKILPTIPFYSLQAELNNGSVLNFEELKGKKVMLVNTASDCGYTNQYEDLQQLHEKFNNKVVIVGFPANDFKEQEKGTDEEIAQFCKKNYGITFLLVKKSSVRKTSKQNEVFKWLSDKTRNGWNNKGPSWNFSKYLVDEEGRLLNYFDPAVSPMSEEILNAIR
jgi:glutathione peroxidase